MTGKYSLVFDGTIVHGHSIEDVKNNLGKLLKIGEKEIERFFVSGSVTIKKDVDYKTALKFQKAFEKAGAVLNIKPVQSPEKTDTTASEKYVNGDESDMVSCPKCGFRQQSSSECKKCGTSFSEEDETIIMQDDQGAIVSEKTFEHDDGTIILTNIETIPGKKIIEHFGLVSGSTIRAKHIGRDLMAGLKNIVGGELKGYTELLNESRRQAIERMMDQTRQLGGNAIVNVRFSTSSVAQGAAELYAYGTAVRVV